MNTINKKIGGGSYFGKSLNINEDRMEKLEEKLPASLKKYDVNKSAFTAGHGITPDTQLDGAANRIESLDRDLKVTTWGNKDFTLYNDIAKEDVDQTVLKYTVYYSHGRTGHSLFQPEIGIGDVNNPNEKQKVINIKFIADTHVTSIALQRANTIVDALKVQEYAAISAVVKTDEWAMFYGDADLTSGQEGEGLQFDGLFKLIDPANHIDLRGGRLSPAALNMAARKIAEGYGTATDAYMPVGIKADFINQHLNGQRIVLPGQTGGMTTGLDIDKFLSAHGDIRMQGSTIMDSDNKLDFNAPTSATAPMAPALSATVTADAGGQWHDKDKTDSKGEVILNKEVGVEQSYVAVMVSRHGDSRPSPVVTATPANATDAVTLTVTPYAMQNTIPDYVAIYRKSNFDSDNLSSNTDASGNHGEYYLIGKVAVREQKGSTITFVDTNARIAGCGDVFVLENRPDTVALKEFIPLSKLNLAVTTTATSFVVLNYVALALYFPRRAAVIENVVYSRIEDLELS